MNHRRFSGTPLTDFHPFSELTVKNVIQKSVIKTCELDPFLTSALNQRLDVLLPYFSAIISESLLSGNFPSIFKSANVRPLVKKTSLDPEILKNYRRVSILSFLSKIREKIVLQLSEHLENNNLLYPHQSAYRSYHSTETALLKIINDLLTALGDSHVSLLSLLDFQQPLISLTTKLCSPISITPLAFLTLLFLGFGRTSFTALRLFLWTETLFPPSVMICEVPQGSVQGPFLFVRYTQPLSDVVHHHSLSSHSFSADNQLYKSGHI